MENLSEPPPRLLCFLREQISPSLISQPNRNGGLLILIIMNVHRNIYIEPNLHQIFLNPNDLLSASEVPYSSALQSRYLSYLIHSYQNLCHPCLLYHRSKDKQSTLSLTNMTARSRLTCHHQKFLYQHYSAKLHSLLMSNLLISFRMTNHLIIHALIDFPYKSFYEPFYLVTHPTNP
jgi:hypothetical protein